jgi:hypothetical protein
MIIEVVHIVQYDCSKLSWCIVAEHDAFTDSDIFVQRREQTRLEAT